jgi:hypothetical protein
MNEIAGPFNLFIQLIDFVVVPFIFALSFVVFIWGVYTYFIAGAGNDEKRKEGRSFILYGLIGFFIMVSLWGIINLFADTFGFNRDSRPDTPEFGSTGSGASNTTDGSGNANGTNFPGAAGGLFNAAVNAVNNTNNSSDGN